MASASALLAYGAKRGSANKTKQKYQVVRSESPQSSSAAAAQPKLLHAFEEAMRRRDFQEVLWMIANGDVDAAHETSTGETAILAAVSAKNADALRMLVDSGVSIDSTNRKGYTPLMRAIAAAAPFAEATAFATGGAALPQIQQRRPLRQRQSSRASLAAISSASVLDAALCASEWGDDNSASGAKHFDNAILQAVLQLKPDVLRRDATGNTAFDWAKRTRNADALRLLDAYHAANSLHNAATSSREQRIAECLALLQRHDECAAALEHNFLSHHSFDENALVRFVQTAVAALPFSDFAASVADLYKARVAIASAFDDSRAAYFVNRESRQGWTPLTKAAANGYVAAVQALVDVGAIVDYETRLRHTALTWASYCGHEAVVLLLLRLGARVDQQTREGKTALIHAVSNAQPKIVHHLLLTLREQSYPTNAKDAFDAGVTALNRRKSMKSAWKRVVRDPSAAVENRLEWHEAFCNLVSVQDASGKSALQYAEDLCRLCHSGDGAETAAAPLSSDDQNNEGDGVNAATACAPAARVLQQLQSALHDAHSHTQYVERNEARTRKTMCRSPGCTFVGPHDTMAVHEQHQCLKRVVHCEQCSAAIVFETQAQHDRAECAMRRVACVNLQHGCPERVVFRDLVTHSAHHCRKRVLSCRRGCGKAVVFDELVAHESAQCPLRTVECELGCPATFLANESAAHRRKHCPKRQIVCTGDAAQGTNSGGSGGCGMLVAAEEMAFHRSHLCEKRKFACRWATHGCTEMIGGSPESRYHHEQRECPFRFALCHNDCALSGSLLHCFLDEHYAWQCERERKPCPHGCEGADDGTTLILPVHLLDVHVLDDAGDCAQRLTRCPLDLCGKRLTLFDVLERSNSNGSSGARLMSSDVALSALERRDTSLRALRQRVATSERFLDRLRRAHSSSGGATNTTSEGGEDAGDGDAVVAGAGEVWELMTRSATTRQVLIQWLEAHHTRLAGDLERVEAEKRRRAVHCRVLTYAVSDDSVSGGGKHLIEFADGHSEWLSLHCREYEVALPAATPSSPPAVPLNAATASDAPVNPMGTFQCPHIEAHALPHHMSHECVLRLVPCPLGCAQRLPAHGVAKHIAKRCSLRNAPCRLSCGAVMPFASLGEHEELACALRSVFCEHCHEPVKWQALESHLQRTCAKKPRRCRLGCSSKVPWCDVADHEAAHCPKRLVTCAQCAKSVWFCELRAHDISECPLREYGPCDAQCGQVLRYNEIGHHLLFNCVQRVVTCTSCDQRVVFAQLQEHKALLCPHRLVRCRRGCGLLLAERDAEHHEEDECAKRVVFCSYKCGAYVPCCDLDAHLELTCPMRVIECPSGCQERLVAHQFEHHWTRCCQRLCACGTGAKACTRPIRLWYADRQLVRCAAHNETALLGAIKTGDEDLVTYFLQNVDAAAALRDECANGFAPLSMAVSLGQVDIVKVLLRFGANVNAETSRGRTALAEACLAQHAELVELLIEHRASVAHTNRHGRNLMATVRSLAAIESESEQQDATPHAGAHRSPWRVIIQLLEDREALERQQRALFVAIATSDYDFVAQFLKFSSARRAGDELQRLRDELHEQKARVEQARAEHSDAIRVFNESVADAEARTVRVANLSEQVLDCTSQIARVAVQHDASVADSSTLEVDMQRLIREITAQDIATLVNVHVPPDAYLVVMKAICMLSGVLPRGRRSADEYTAMEWWKTAQALLMDRTLLQRLRGYRKSVVTPDLMTKVRRECLRTPAFAASTALFDALAVVVEDTPNSVVERKSIARLPPVESLRGDIVTLLAAWVKGVEMEYKSRAEQQTFGDRKRRLAISLSATRETLQQAQFDMHVAARSLPARQDEVEAARAAVESEDRALLAAQQRLQAFRVLTFAALNGHTPLSFAAAVGNEAMVHLLLAHGARAGYADDEEHLCASFLQLLARDFVTRRRAKRQRETNSELALKTRSDETVGALVRSVALTFLLSHYRRKIAFFRQTHRVALHEAVFNGFPQVADVLLAHGATLWHKTRVLPLRAFPGAIGADDDKQHALPGGWELTPLLDNFVDAAAHCGSDRRPPMLLRDTLELAMQRWDCKTFRAGKGWDPHATRYSETHAFVTAALETLDAAQQQKRKEIVARKRVAKKAAELRALHAALDCAIVARDFAAVSELLDAGAYADYETTRDGLSALMAACVEERYVQNSDKRDVLAVEYLLDRVSNRPSVNFESSTGRTALSTAAHYGALLCAQALLERGASVNLASRHAGATALMAAASNGQIDVVRFLIEQPDVDVLAVDRMGRTAFAHAQARDCHGAMHLLGAAMTGNRGCFYSSVSALHGVCKWGCGFMAAVEGRSVHHSIVTHVTHPLAHHEAHACPKRLVACPLRCSAEIWAERLPQHVASECRLRIVTCAQPKCGASFPYEQLVRHNRDECDWRVVHCSCGEQMAYLKHVAHAASRCVMRLVACPFACDDGGDSAATLRFVDLKHHTSAECPNRRVRCRNGCSASDLLFKHRGHHEQQVCALRRVQCKWGCDEVVRANAQQHHESDDCLLRQVSCPNKCGQLNVPVFELQQHVAERCAHRLVPCALGCGRRVPLHVADHHAQSECRKRIVACEQCGEQLIEGDRSAHQSSACAQRISLCGLCGQTNIPLAQLATHRAEYCKMRPVACRYACFVKQLLAHEKERHESAECAFRPIWCPLGCREVLVANTLKKHERVCTMRFVSCSLGCGVELRERDRAHHEATECAQARRQTGG